MTNATIVLTIAIAFIALADVTFTLLPAGLIRPRPALRPKFGKRSTTGSSVQRAVCLACLVSMVVALVMAHQDLKEKDFRRDVGKGKGFVCLALLLAFNVSLNSILLYMGYFSKHSSNARAKSFTDEESGVSPPKVKRASFKVSQGSQVVQAAIRTPEKLSQASCTSLDPLSTSGRINQQIEVLDRRDSDIMMRNIAPIKMQIDAQQEPYVIKAHVVSGDDEKLLDALMLDAVKVLVDC